MLKNKSGTEQIKVNGADQYVAITRFNGTDGWILVMAADRGEMMPPFGRGSRFRLS
jgi:hypothetical protein